MAVAASEGHGGNNSQGFYHHSTHRPGDEEVEDDPASGEAERCAKGCRREEAPGQAERGSHGLRRPHLLPASSSPNSQEGSHENDSRGGGGGGL
eukprot:746115-Hanusia_phi.AAC.3